VELITAASSPFYRFPVFGILQVQKCVLLKNGLHRTLTACRDAALRLSGCRRSCVAQHFGVKNIGKAEQSDCSIENVKKTGIRRVVDETAPKKKSNAVQTRARDSHYRP